MSASDPLLQLTCAALVLLAPVGVGLVHSGKVTGLRRAAVIAGAFGAAGALAAAAALGTLGDPAARILDAAMAAAIGATIAILATERLGAAGGTVFAVVYGLLVGPVVTGAVLGEYPSLLLTVFGAVDYAGVLATHVAPASALLVLVLVPQQPPPAYDALSTVELPNTRRALLGTLFVVTAALAWLVGLERVVEDATGRIAANGLVGILLATAAWVLMERVRWARFTPAGMVVGACAGWAVVGLGAPFLSPVALIAAAVLGGLAAGAVPGAPSSRPRREQARTLLSMIVAVIAGGVITSILGDGFGLAATGTLTLTAAQIGAVIGVSVLAAAGAVPGMLVALATRAVWRRWRAVRS